MEKDILLGKEAKQKLIDGINKLCDAIKITLGPKGRNVIISDVYARPFITNDGATIAREISLSDSLENIGVELIKEVAIRTNELVGDGTTTATILAQAMLKTGLEEVELGVNPIFLKDELIKIVDRLILNLEKLAEPITTKNQIIDIATISSGDKEIGNLLGDAFEIIGDNGIITVEAGNYKNELIEINGYEFDGDYLSEHLLDDTIKKEAALLNPYILITDKSILTLDQIIPILEQVINCQGSLLIIANKISEEVMKALIMNKKQGILNIQCVKAPSSLAQRKDLLNDISIFTKGMYIAENSIENLEDLKLENLGKCGQVIIKNHSTILMDGAGDTQAQIIKLIEKKNNVDTEFERDFITNRISKLNSKTVLLKVGGASELEVREKQFKIEDAICSVKSAKKKGIVPGGGITLIRLSRLIKPSKKDSKVRETAKNIIRDSLKRPFIQLLENSGIENYEFYLDKVNNTNGYNVHTGRIVHMKNNGIIDPALVQIEALKSAVSIAAMILTTDAIIADTTKESRYEEELRRDLIDKNEKGLF